jgi:hypothetical protein
MSTQQNPSIYAAAIQYQLASILSPVPVYANFNRNYATQPKFATWQLRNVHQPVYTGTTQSVKGIDRPTFQITIFASSLSDSFAMSNSVLQSLHGYSGILGNPTSGGFYVAKVDVVWIFHTYDNEIGLHQVVLDATFDVPT